MIRAPYDMSYISSRLSACLETGRLYWKDASKHHARLNGLEAGSPRASHNGKRYWHVKLKGVAVKRAHIILALKTGVWPEQCADHINGDSLDDRAENLRHATVTQNAWNHKSRTKKSQLPMGVRQTVSGRFQARIAANKKKISVGVFPSIAEASAAYAAARKEYFGDYS
jgi:hypothetical protein